MKTAMEMIRCVLDSGFYMEEEQLFNDCCIVKKLLTDDEEVLMCFVGVYDYKLNSDNEKDVLCVMTNKRFIIVTHNNIKNPTTIIPIENIEKVSSSIPDLFLGLVVLKTKEQEINIRMGYQNCKIVDATINEELSKLRNSIAESTTININEMETNNQEESIETIMAIDKIKKLEDLLNLEELEFTDFQKRYVYYIIDYIRRNQEIRTAIFIGFKFENVHSIVAFTTQQFNEIKKILK